MLCAGVAALFLQDGDSLWGTLARCLDEHEPLLVNREALRLLSLLCVGIPDSFNLDKSFYNYYAAYMWVITLVENNPCL